MARTTIRSTQSGSVALSYICSMTGEKVRRVFAVAGSGGFVRDEYGNQVCEYLKHTGPALTAHPDNLLFVIRRQWRNARAVKRRKRARF